MQDRQPRYRLSPQTSLAHVFETPLVVSALVPALIRIYIDIEFTERHNQARKEAWVDGVG